MLETIRQYASLSEISTKAKTDTLWNGVAFGIAGASGLLLLMLIARFYTPGDLGVFNISYSIYLVLSQVFVLGIHLSVLKLASQYLEDPVSLRSVLTSGLLTVMALGVLFIAATYYLRNLFGIFYDSSNQVHSLTYLLPGLYFFICNKVFLSFMNGRSVLRSFAVFTALRPILLVTSLVGLIIMGVEGGKIPIIFSVTESALFVLLLIYNFGYLSIWRRGKSLAKRTRQHLSFGIRSFWGSVFLDVNTKVDVLVLGIFVSDRLVGIYSFAAVLIEGFIQLPTVFRTVINPKITQSYYRGREHLSKLITRSRPLFYKVLVPVGAVCVLAYPLPVWLLELNPDYMDGWVIFGVLISGVLAVSGYWPFWMILGQTGLPLAQSGFYTGSFLANLVLNLILVPMFGPLGAAVATSIAYVVSLILLRNMVGKKLDVKM